MRLRSVDAAMHRVLAEELRAAGQTVSATLPRLRGLPTVTAIELRIPRGDTGTVDTVRIDLRGDP